MELGKRLRELRDASGMTQQGLAIKAGLAVSHVAQIEQGQKADPRISTVAALARALGVAIDTLVKADGVERGPKRSSRPRKGK
jgi:transcriptional regulator with XRE-family HTH domain